MHRCISHTICKRTETRRWTHDKIDSPPAIHQTNENEYGRGFVRRYQYTCRLADVLKDVSSQWLFSLLAPVVFQALWLRSYKVVTRLHSLPLWHCLLSLLSLSGQWITHGLPKSSPGTEFTGWFQWVVSAGWLPARLLSKARRWVKSDRTVKNTQSDWTKDPAKCWQCLKGTAPHRPMGWRVFVVVVKVRWQFGTARVNFCD